MSKFAKVVDADVRVGTDLQNGLVAVMIPGMPSFGIVPEQAYDFALNLIRAAALVEHFALRQPAVSPPAAPAGVQ